LADFVSCLFFSNVPSLKSRDRFFLCSFSQFQEKQITLMHKCITSGELNFLEKVRKAERVAAKLKNQHFLETL
jgi:hypothetical protein